jgi:ClpP class serine protease
MFDTDKKRQTMKNFRLITELAYGAWSIEATGAAAMMPLVAKILSGDISSLEFQSIKDSEADVDLNARVETITGLAGERSSANVGVVDFKDVIIKSDAFCGPEGTETKARNILDMAADPSIAAIILDIDSPGGSVSAMPIIIDAIKQAREFKPVLAYCGNGMAASCGYWIASTCDEIYTTYDQDEVGSIGTMVTIANWDKHLKEMYSLEVSTIYAKGSDEKNLAFRQAMDEENPSTELLSEMVTVHRNDFAAHVQTNRGEKLDAAALKGAMYRTKEAIQMGLIDGQKSRKEVFERAVELSSSQSYSPTSTPNSMFGKGKKSALSFIAVNALAQAKPEERTAEMHQAAATELSENGINALVFATGNEQTEAEAFLGKKSAVTTAEKEAKTASEATTAALDVANEYLGADASVETIGEAVAAVVKAAKTTAPIEGASSGKEGASGEGKTFEETTAGFAHNQRADKKA